MQSVLIKPEWTRIPFISGIGDIIYIEKIVVFIFFAFQAMTLQFADKLRLRGRTQFAPPKFIFYLCTGYDEKVNANNSEIIRFILFFRGEWLNF